MKRMKLAVIALGLMFSAFPAAATDQKGSVTPNATTKKTVQKAQQRLRELGYDPGVADGAMGARTSAALKKFQLDHRLPGSGVLDPKTLDALNSQNAPAKAQAAPSPAPPSGPPPEQGLKAPEKYEPVSPSDFHVEMQLKGDVEWDANGVANGGPVVKLSFWGHDIELTDDMIKDGFISTRNYGKIQIKPGANFSMQLFLTPTQQKKLKELAK